MATELDKLVVKIEADLRDLKKGLNNATSQVNSSTSKMGKSFNKLNQSILHVGKRVTQLGAIAGVTFGTIFTKNILSAGIQMEELALRMGIMFGNVEEGNKAFEVLTQFAARVPFSLEEILRGAGSLLAISDSALELGKNLEIVGNLAATSTEPFEVAASQFQRVASAGIGAAEILKEKGIAELLGFEAGVSVTAEKSVKIFEEAFGEGGRFADSTQKMAGTLRGVFSQVQDSLFKFESAVGGAFIPRLTAHFGDLVKVLQENEEEIKRIGEEIGTAMADGVKFLVENREAIVFALKALGVVALASAVNFATFGVATKAVAVGLNLIGKHPALKLLGALGLATTISSSAMNHFEKELEDVNKKIEDQTKKLKKNNDALRITIKSVNKASETVSAQTKEIVEGIIDIVNKAGDALSRSVAKAVVAGQSLRDTFRDVFRTIIEEIIALTIRILVLEPILKRFEETLRRIFNMEKEKGGKKSTGDRFKDLAFQVAGSLITGNFGGGLANGGMVAPNTPYLVGERGAELFVPSSSGQVVPNGGFGGVTVNQSINVSTGISQTVRAEIMNMLPLIKGETINAVAETRRRGGSFARTFGA